MKKLKRWIGSGLWIAGGALVWLLPWPYTLYAYMPAMFFQFYEWGHFNGWREGFRQCDLISQSFMEMDQKRIKELWKKVVEHERREEAVKRSEEKPN